MQVASKETSLRRLVYKYFWPSWLFKDASRGDCLARAAAYRHNREKCIYLPVYLARWLFIALFAWTATASFEAQVALPGVFGKFFLYLTAGSAVIMACAVCVLAVFSYAYLYLSRITPSR